MAELNSNPRVKKTISNGVNIYCFTIFIMVKSINNLFSCFKYSSSIDRLFRAKMN